MQLEESVIDHVVQGFHIPPKPEILERVQTLAQTPNIDPAEVGQCIATDVGLSASILKTLNSPFYGMARTITDVTQATILLGTNSVLNLVAAIKIREAMQGDSCISLERFWDSASDISNAMTYIGKKANVKIPPENLHIVGLFHDCGLPAMAIKYSNYVEILKVDDNDHDSSITQIENKHYNSNHAVIGYYIASSWGLPKELCNVIRQHHDPRALEHKVTPEFRVVYACLKMACNILEKLRRFKNTRDWPIVEESVLSSLGFTDLDYQDLSEDIAEMFS
jgi:HD-like signal output (HDOD) protein